MSASTFTAAAAAADITPLNSQFLYGYPHVQRMSTGVNDPLWASALYLNDGKTAALFIGNDIIWVPRSITTTARRRIEEATGVPGQNILISGTHTHSAPIVGKMVVASADPAVPPQDPAYLQRLEQGIVEAGIEAFRRARPATIALGRADATGIGTNRHDPQGPADLEVPVLAARDEATGKTIGLMLVCHMHPTVLHEDSKLVSGDFPGLARQYLQRHVVGEDCPIVYHMGTAGNQSPRHVTKANTVAEAQRLGDVLGRAVQTTLATLDYLDHVPIAVSRENIELPLRPVPPLAEAEDRLTQARQHYRQLQRDSAPRTEVRTAECDVFGAEETVTLAKAAASGKLAAVARDYMPAEVLVIRLGKWKFIGWPGEVFVEYGLMVRQADPDAFVITLAGSDLQGYLVTQEGIDKQWYEANNAIFKSPESPQRLVEATIKLLAVA